LFNPDSRKLRHARRQVDRGNATAGNQRQTEEWCRDRAQPATKKPVRVPEKELVLEEEIARLMDFLS
jgi:hypothetical protein